MTEDEVNAAVAELGKPKNVAGQLKTYAEGVDAEGWHSTANVMLRGAKTIEDLVEMNEWLERRITAIMEANNALVAREREAKVQARMATNRALAAERRLAVFELD
ncbi:hypothetical protein [Microcystis phage Mwe-JY26]